MRVYAPPFYNYFSCKTGECKHSCCIGWEIEIDSATAERYRGMTGAFGQRVRANIAGLDTNAPHFILKKDKRCPFLRRDGLCEMIRIGGEGAIPQICALHPRYRNDFAGRCEIGLGLCCEEAVRLTLTYIGLPIPRLIQRPERVEETLPTFSIKEQALLIERNALITSLFTGASPKRRLDRLAGGYRDLTLGQCEKMLRGLNRFDPEWDVFLDRIKDSQVPVRAVSLGKQGEHAVRLAAYFINRYFPRVTDDLDRTAVLALASLAPRLIAAMCNCSKNRAYFEAVRRFSVEVEYDEENMSKMLNFLKENEF